MTEITSTNSDIDYENMDDLPLSGHFEWQYFQIETVAPPVIEESQEDWLAA